MPDASVAAAESPARILVIDSRRQLHARIAPALATDFDVVPTVTAVAGGRAALEAMRSGPADIVLAELHAIADLASAVDERISRLARAASGALIVALAEDPGISVSLAAMRAGAHDCVGCAIDGTGLTRLIGELAQRHGKARCLTRSAPRPETPAGETDVPDIPDMRDLVMPMWRQEQRIIEEAIQQFAGNVALAAAALELSPSTIYRKRQAWAEMEERRGAA